MTMVDAGAAAAPRQVLTFLLGDEEYGVDVLRVQEIRVWERVTRLPEVPAFVKGVMNLRGEIVPVVDLRERFRLPVEPYGPRTVVIVLRVLGGRERTIGAVVDAVTDVQAVAADDVRPAPPIARVVGADAIQGLATLGERMVVLLDVDRLMDEASLVAVERRATQDQAGGAGA